VYNPALLGIGSPLDIAWVFFTCSVGVVGLGIGVIGYWKGNLSKSMRALFVVAALCLIIPEAITDVIGLVSLGLLMFFQIKKSGSSVKTI
nr:hypothetical protein [Synergistaceae bacterium]